MRMLFDYFDTDRLIICLDPSNLELLHDFYADRSTTKILEIECQFTDDYLIGHAKRVGLAGELTSQTTLERLLPTIRNDLALESDHIRDAGFSSLYVMTERNTDQVNAEPISQFLSIGLDPALEIARTDHLFSD